MPVKEVQKLINIYENLDSLSNSNVRMQLKEVIENLKDSRPKVKDWIPIGQYPTAPCLLCFENGSMAVGYYDCSNNVCILVDGLEFYSNQEPIAWQPLPKPYEEI